MDIVWNHKSVYISQTYRQASSLRTHSGDFIRVTFFEFSNIFNKVAGKKRDTLIAFLINASRTINSNNDRSKKAV